MQARPKQVKTVLFDLGDVGLPLDKKAMYTAFGKLAGKTAEAVEKIFGTDAGKALYKAYEHDMPTEEFYLTVKKLLGIPTAVENDSIDQAWNALLLPIPQERIDHIQALRNAGYETVLLSNSNDIHYDRIQLLYGEEFRKIFTEQYYSHQLKKAKPNADSFIHALNGRDPETVVFLDDKKENIDAANKLGIHGVVFPVPLSAPQSIQTIANEAIKKANAKLAKDHQTYSYAVKGVLKAGLFGALVTAGSAAVAYVASTMVPKK